MLLAEDGRRSLLYTGDFKLGESATAERAELPQAEILIVESTYGHPDYRLPPREEALGRLFEEVRKTLEGGAVPVIEAYALGKAQEVTRLLSDRGFPVLQHKGVFEISRIYESFGVDLGRYALLEEGARPGHVLVVPPGTRRFDQTAREVRFAVTGWAVDERAKYRLWVGHPHPPPPPPHYHAVFVAGGPRLSFPPWIGYADRSLTFFAPPNPPPKGLEPRHETS